MNIYYYDLNVDQNNRHEIHKEDCPRLPDILNRKELGYQLTPEDALQEARLDNPFYLFDGCPLCDTNISNK